MMAIKMRVFFVLLLILSVMESCQSVPSRDVYTNHWAVRVTGGHGEADRLAAKYGYNNLGQVMVLLNFLVSH